MVFAIRNFRCPVYHTTAGLGWAGLGCLGWAGLDELGWMGWMGKLVLIDLQVNLSCTDIGQHCFLWTL